MLDNRQILTIDDSRTIRTFLRTLLTPYGCEMHEADSGEAGLALSATTLFDLVLLDLLLPDMQGIDVLRTIRTTSAHSTIVVLTGMGRWRICRHGGSRCVFLPDETYVEGARTLEPVDALIVYSDGLVDARPELHLEPRDRAARLTGAANAEEMVGRLVALGADVTPLPDDLTVLALRCTGLS